MSASAGAGEGADQLGATTGRGTTALRRRGRWATRRGPPTQRAPCPCPYPCPWVDSPCAALLGWTLARRRVPGGGSSSRAIVAMLGGVGRSPVLLLDRARALERGDDVRDRVAGADAGAHCYCFVNRCCMSWRTPRT